ncbi:hypothetical protein ANTQUA_LOCUS9071 [Anthophora quadrimaculata]
MFKKQEGRISGTERVQSHGEQEKLAEKEKRKDSEERGCVQRSAARKGNGGRLVSQKSAEEPGSFFSGTLVTE